jgi:hypothetical protein
MHKLDLHHIGAASGKGRGAAFRIDLPVAQNRSP